MAPHTALHFAKSRAGGAEHKMLAARLFSAVGKALRLTPDGEGKGVQSLARWQMSYNPVAHFGRFQVA